MWDALCECFCAYCSKVLYSGHSFIHFIAQNQSSELNIIQRNAHTESFESIMPSDLQSKGTFLTQC